MPSFHAMALVLLPALSALGAYCTWGLSERNGFFPMMKHLRDVGPHYLPGTQEPLRRHYTGIDRPIDHLLTVLTTIFWPTVDGSYPDLALSAFHLGGQIMALWILLEVEARRMGNTWRLISFTTLWGLCIQSMAFTVVAPLYFLLHLLTSPTTLSYDVKTLSTYSTNLLVSPTSLYVLPISVTVGFALPALLMCLPSPQYSSFDTHQIFIAMWQIFPLLVSAAQQLLSRLASIVVPSKKAYRSAAERNLAHMRALRRVYIFAFVVSSVSHIASLALSFASIIVPAIFKPSIVAALHPAQVFIPSSPIAAPPAKSLGDGFHTFLMFDGIIGLTATLVWAIVLNRNAHGSHPIGASGWASLLVKVTGLTLVAGPAGAAIALVWGRDELVLEEGEGGVTDHSKKSI